MVNTLGMMEGRIKDTGLTITCMGKEYTDGPTEENTKENTRKTENADMACSIGQTAACMTECGKMDIKTGRASIKTVKELSNTTCGETARNKNGSLKECTTQ